VVFVLLFATIHPIIKLCRLDGNLGNFFVFRDTAIALSHGQDLYAQSNDYVYPPLIAFLYQPFASIPPHAAGAISLIINALLFLATIWLLAVELSRRFLNRTNALFVARVAAVATLLTCDKIRGELNSWETNVQVLFMLTAALVLADRRPWLAGAALGFAFDIKYLPITLIPYLILRRRWTMVGGFAASALLFSLLPAISMGWNGNLHALGEAYGGLAGLFKIPVHHAAHLYPMTDWRTLSVTSGIARFTGWPDQSALSVAAMLGCVFASFAALASQRHNLSPLWWPPSLEQRDPRHRAMFAIELIVVMMLTLVFSPFTNGAHLYLLLVANAAGAALLFSTPHRSSRWPLIIGMAVMYVGITLPPGGAYFRTIGDFSKWIGFPAWCVLVNCGTLFWTDLRIFCCEPAPVARTIAPTAALVEVRGGLEATQGMEASLCRAVHVG